jgi:hypothetical protein
MNNKATFAWQGWKPAFYYTKKYIALAKHKTQTKKAIEKLFTL